MALRAGFVRWDHLFRAELGPGRISGIPYRLRGQYIQSGYLSGDAPYSLKVVVMGSDGVPLTDESGNDICSLFLPTRCVR